MARLTRREILILSAATAVAQPRWPIAPQTVLRIAKLIHEYGGQGFHRTGTKVDGASGDWLMKQVRDAGLDPSRETFSIDRVDPITASLSGSGERIDGLPLFDGGFTDAAGVSGKLGPLGSDAEIGLAESAPNTAEAGALGEARRNGRHRAIVLVTRGQRPGLCPNNAESFLKPFGPPVVQISSEDKPRAEALAKSGAKVVAIAQVKRTPAEAFNVIARIAGSDKSLPPLIVMTPRSGWYTCASERGGGIACWLELMRNLRMEKSARDVIFVASSGHEIGQHGIEIFAERRPELMKHSRAWVHFGANVGAALEPGNNIQASDDEMEAIEAKPMLAAELTIDRRVPRGTVPGGEAGVVHRGGGRYLSLIGRSALFHNIADRGPDAVDVAMIARIAVVFTGIARELARNA